MKRTLKLKVNQDVYYLENKWYPYSCQGFYLSRGIRRLVFRRGTFLHSVFGNRMIKDKDSGDVKCVSKYYVFLTEKEARSFANFANHMHDALVSFGTQQIIRNVFGG